MAVARKIAYNIIASSASKILSTFLALVSIAFITRYLGKDGFGNYATALAFLSFFSALADLGLYHIATREISRCGADEKKIISNVFTLRLAVSFLIVLLSPLIIIFFDYPPEVKRGIFIVALAFFFSSSYQVLNGVFQKNLSMDRVAFGELAGKIIQTAIIIGAVKYDLGFNWIISSLLGHMIFTSFLIFFWSRKYVRLHLSFDFAYWKKFLRESLPMGISAITTFAYFKMDTIILSVIKESSDVGIYNAAYKILENITFFPAMVTGLIMPILSYNIFTNFDKFKEIADKTFKFFTIVTIPLVVVTLFFSENIIALIGGAGFSESAVVLRIIIFALALIFFGHLFSIILIAGNYQKILMYVLAIAAAISITLNIILIPRFSYLAAAYVSVATELIVVALTIFAVAKKIKYLPVLSKIHYILTGAFFMALIFSFSQNFHFLLSITLGTAVYFAVLWFFKVINAQEIISLIDKKDIERYEKIS